MHVCFACVCEPTGVNSVVFETRLFSTNVHPASGDGGLPPAQGSAGGPPSIAQPLDDHHGPEQDVHGRVGPHVQHHGGRRPAAAQPVPPPGQQSSEAGTGELDNFLSYETSADTGTWQFPGRDPDKFSDMTVSPPEGGRSWTPPRGRQWAIPGHGTISQGIAQESKPNACTECIEIANKKCTDKNTHQKTGTQVVFF